MDKWELYIAPQLKACSTCRYNRINGATVGCYYVVGVCTRSGKWAPVIDMEGFNPELYMQQPTVMPEEKGYMDFDGVV
jgi:L-serine deaminase